VGGDFRALQEIIKLDQNHIEAQCNIGSIYYKKGNLEEALSEFKKVLELDPENTYAKKMLAECRKILDKKQ
jgi:tetratricopeptide (TPR) repeat protein